MQSAGELKDNQRADALRMWLENSCGLSAANIQSMRHDASFRRYFRLQTGDQSYVVMDAPPPAENCRPYVAIAKALRAMGLQTPAILQAEVEQGFLLISDFGDTTYLDALKMDNADLLYSRALDALAVMHTCKATPPHTLPPFTADFMRQEWTWHQEWFLYRLLNLTPNNPALNDAYERLVQEAISQPPVFMHRDYHSANLMVVENSLGILDFQDAFIGPLTYDLASLLRDCYIDWPQEKVEQWALSYWQRLQKQNELTNISAAQFIRWFDFMGLQRHLKALFTFARKHVRDHQSSYLGSVPRVLRYVEQVSSRYPELSALHDYYLQQVQPVFIAFNKGR